MNSYNRQKEAAVWLTSSALSHCGPTLVVKEHFPAANVDAADESIVPTLMSGCSLHTAGVTLTVIMSAAIIEA